jgi:hypothetical protein
MTRGTRDRLACVEVGWVLGLVFGVIAHAWWTLSDRPGVPR